MRKRLLGSTVAHLWDKKGRRNAAKNLALFLNQCEKEHPKDAQYLRMLNLVEGLRSFALEPERRVEIAAALNPVLRKFSVYPELDAGENRPGEWSVIENRERETNSISIQVLLSLLEYGANDNGINWLRRCRACNRWFFASREKNLLCSDSCWEDMYRSRPGYAKQNAKYQRTFYKLHPRKTTRKRRKKGGR